MDANSLIRYIYDNNQTEYILEQIGCHHINNHFVKEWRCALPNHHNPTKVSIKKNGYLSMRIFDGADNTSGNIITLLMYIDKCNFISALKKIHKILKIPFTKITKNNFQLTQKPTDIFKKMCQQSNQKVNFEDMLLNDGVITNYSKHLHISWYKEGIIHKTAQIFDLGYDYDRNRIIIPHRYWSGDADQYIGLIGRTTIPNYEIFNIPKYFPLKAYPKSMNLYGLHENYEQIQKQGYVVVFEAEKSVLKRHSRNDATGVALMGHEMSQEQVRILLGLNVEIIIAMDQDVSLEHIWKMCSQFYKKRRVSYIYDKYHLLKDKESPADTNNKMYQWFLKYRKVFDEEDMKGLIKWQEKQKKNWKY